MGQFYATDSDSSELMESQEMDQSHSTDNPEAAVAVALAVATFANKFL